MSSATPTAALAPQIRAGAALRRLEGFRPLYVLSGFVVVEWLTTLAVALKVRHNGWLYYQGGDQLWHYVTAWVMANGHLPHTSVGYAWSIVLLPFALLGGPDLVSPLPFIILLNVLVLMPVALLSAYGIGQRIGGRLFGYWVAALWIVVPLIGIKYTDAGYHQRYTELLLPQSLGLSVMSDFPSMVASAAAAYFALRAVQTDDRWDGILAGVLAGIAIGIKPSNAPLLVGIALAVLAARRWRSMGYIAAGLAPSFLALVLWKGRGEGNLPLFKSGASPTGLVMAHAAPVLGLGGLNIHQYIHPSWSIFNNELLSLQEHFWSLRVLEWFAIAGLIGLFRRSRPAGFLFGGWLFATLFVKWTTWSHGATIDNSDLLRQTISTIPAALILIAGTLLLFPGLPQRLRSPEPRSGPARRLQIGLAAALTTVFVVVPAALSASLPLLPNNQTLEYFQQITETTGLSAPFGVDHAWHAAAGRRGNRVRLAWARLDPPGGTMDYLVIRAPAKEWLFCDVTSGGSQCRLLGSIIATTRGTSIVDRPPPGSWVYRVGAVASWISDPTAGDIYVVGTPVRVTVRR